jgi:hypothetical protein
MRAKIIKLRTIEPLRPVPETPSVFHPHAQRNAFRRRGVRRQSRLFVPGNQRLKHAPYCAKTLRKKFHALVKCRSLKSLDNIMKTTPIAQDSGWNFSFWFAVSSPLLGVLLAMVALAIFCR